MKSLLCGILSFAILINSASPALAQLVPAGRAVSRAGAQASRRAAQAGTHMPTLLRNVGANTKQIAHVTARTQAIQTQTTRQVVRLQRQLPTVVQYQPWIAKTAIPSLAVNGDYSRVAQRILATPVLEQAPLLRNEFVLLSLTHQVTPAQLETALDFLRSDLQKNLPTFKTISGQSMRTVLNTTEGVNAAESCRKALSDAAALALTGTAADAQALISLYQAAASGPLAEVATRLTGRGLLRLGAYDLLNEWAAPLKQEGEFWLGLTSYARENHLPVSLNPSVAAQPGQQVAGLTVWLESGSLVNGLNASDSLAATEKWMELGRTAKPAAETSSVSQAPAASGVVADLTDMNLLGTASGMQLAPSELPQTEFPVNVTGSAAKQPVARAGTTTAVSSSSSGVLYGGLPVFAILKTTEKAWNWLRRFWHKEEDTPTRQAIREEPGLHDNTVRPVYERSLAPSESIEAEDMQAMAEAPSHAEVAESGFKLTVENSEAVESILHNVDVTIDTGIKADGYNRVVLSKDHIFELRNLTQPSKQMAHFFFKLSSSTGALYQLALSAGESSFLHRELRVKLERRPNVRYKAVSLPAVDFNSGKKLNVLFEVDAKLLPKGTQEGKILLEKSGKIYYEGPEGKQTLLEGYYVRLPKEDSKYWVPLMQRNPGTNFSLEIHSTRNKTGILTQAVPFLQIGLGKTTAPELKARSTMGESSASLIMLSINNVLPVMMGFVNPLLKRYGEAKVLRWGQGLFVAGGATALASGLYGALGNNLMTSLQLAGFISSSVMIALGTNITRFVQNNLISANRGKIVPKNSFSEPAKTASQAGPAAPTYNLKYLGRRFVEVFTKTPTAARDVVLFQTATMFKNLGTMAFLAFPWMTNVAAKYAFGIDLGLDFSASYIPYSIFGLWTAMKLRRIAYKDAFPMNLTTVSNNFKEMLATTTTTLAEQPIHSLEGSEILMRVAKEIKSSIDDLTRVEIRQFKTSLAKQVSIHETESINALREKLLARGASAEEAETGAIALQKAFDSLDHRDVSLWKVLMTPKLAPSVAAMALATMHELSVSNGFSFAMHNLLGDGAQANAYTALALYGSMSAGRILGNIISRRISGGSMYALSSLFSLGGTAMMAASAGNNVSSLIAGAIIASFGVGNFFSQMYEYMVGLSPKHRREIALLINYTMPVAAVMSFPMRWLVGATGFSGMDLVVAEAAAVASVMLTPGMLANSSLVKVGKNLWAQSIDKIKNLGRKTPPPTSLGADGCSSTVMLEE